MLLFVLMLLSQPVMADIYLCEQADGVSSYQDEPCPGMAPKPRPAIEQPHNEIQTPIPQTDKGYRGNVSEFIGLVDVMYLSAAGCKTEMQISGVGEECNRLIKHFPRFAEMIDYHRASPDQFLNALKSRGVQPEVFMDQVMSIQNDMNAIKFYLE